MAAAPAPSQQQMNAERERLMKIRAQETAKGEAMFKRLSDAIEVAPFFLCSTHGSYDRSGPPVKWTVPENTFIFEAQEIGDLTLTDLDIPLWELLQGGRRWGFMKYLTLDYDEIAELTGHKAYDQYKQVFSNFILYKPGDEIYERVLSIGGGRHDETSGSRDRYAGMGFFRFDPRAPAYKYQGYGREARGEPKGPYEILRTLQTKMVEDGTKQLTDRSFVEYVNLTNRAAPTWRDGTPITDVNFRTASPAGLAAQHPRIFIFSSCAAVEEERSAAGSDRWDQVVAVQRQRINEASADLGIHSLLGFSQYGSSVNNPGVSKVAPGAPDPCGGSARLNSSCGLRLKKSHAPAEFYVPLRPTPGAIDLYSMEDPDLQPGYLYLSREERDELESKEQRKQARVAAARATGAAAAGKKGGRRKSRRVKRNSKRSHRAKKTRRTL